MYKVEPNLKRLLNLTDWSIEQLITRYNDLLADLKFARNAFEFEKTSDIKTEMVYIKEEMNNRKKAQMEEEAKKHREELELLIYNKK
ncbi:hypothetical protein [Halalkalibacter sp. APA_J-10(15)]|uniref:hypothetical protein n=1 Tax=unclassified Halalkalibacter TaxID=2893063 RepID=UPI001FF1E23C|nr:hypothetical protein [Halalkalibacter sp. APA_J-10(15)]MCK0473399.1 hypothetical protein [Halalkalibacter sp. APA_J-10(15)]